MNKRYDNPARPFELWNIGNYETVYWQEREDEHRFKNIKELISTLGG